MDQLAALLDGSLAGVGDARAQCEAQLTSLLRSPGFALQLCEFLFTTTAAVAPAHRQLACILLKKLVMSHWTVGAAGDDDDDEHEAPAPGDGYLVADSEKAQVRHAIVASVQRVDVLAFFAESKLQTALCMALTAIFERDWPDQWPELLPVVLGMISGNERLAIEFAIRFLSLAGNHFSSENCCELVSVVFPQLQRVFVAKDDFAVGVRTRVVRIVESSLLMVGMEAQVGNKTAQQLLQTNVSQWIALFLAELPLPVQQVKAYAIKIQIINTLSKFVEEWPKDMTDVLPEIMPQIYGLLASDMAAFDRDVVQNSETEEEAYDSDGEGTHIGRGAVVVAAFEFLRGTLHAPTKKTRQLVLTALNEFVYVMIAYMQITASQAETWEDDPNKYVADEDDESLSYNIRTAGTDLLIELETVLGRKAVVAALDAAQRRLKGEAGNWRLQEAALLVVGTLASPILAAMSKQSADVSQLLDLGSFLQTLFQVMNASNETIYLRARALWCASKLAKGMNSEMLSAFLQVAISGLEQGQVLPVRLYACRAVGAIVKHEAGKQHLQEASAVIVERLIHLAELSTNETLHIALETLVVVLQELGNLSPAAAQATVAAFLRHWSQNLNDPLISELLDGAFGALLEYENMEIVANLQEQVLPVLQTMLLQSKAELGAAGNGTVIAGSAITVLKTILKHSFVSSTATAAGSSDPTHRAMSAQIIQLIFEPLIGILELVDDEKVLNSGAECLKWLVMFAVETLAEYKCANGANGVDATMNIAAKLLSPALDESCAVCVGGLIAQILLKLGSALPAATIQSILSATCARLSTAELPSLIQSLCMVFARLVHTHGQEILNVLEQLPAPVVPGVSYKNMLEFVFSTWIEKQQDFYGLYCIKVTVSALLKVAEWNDPRLTEIIVTGSEVETAPQPGNAGIQTRSKTKSSIGSAPKQYTRVHFLTKLVVVLAKVAVHLGEDEEEWESSEDESEDDEDDDSAAVSGATSSSIFAPAEQYELLSDRLDSNAADAGDDEGADGTEEEFEAHFDPLNDVDLKVLLPAALQSVTSNGNVVQAMLPELTAADQEILALVTGAN